MYKRLLYVFLTFLIFSFSPAWADSFLTTRVLAHPADQVFLDVFVNKDKPSTASADMYLSWQQLGYVLDKYGEVPDEKKQPVGDDESLNRLFQTYKEYDSVFIKYLKNNLEITNSKKLCVLDFLENPVINKEEILVGKGYKFKLNITCDTNIKNGFYVKSNLYVEDYPYQTLFVDLKIEDKSYTAAFYKDDTEKEVIQKNQPKNTSSNLNLSTISSSNLQNNFYSALQSGSILAFVLLFLIGALHTLEAGHSKAIIFSLASHKDTTFKQGLYYVLVFTTTHVADILLLALIFIFLNSTVDIYKNLPLLSKLSLATLLIISLYMLYSGIKNLKNSKMNSLTEIKQISHTNFLNKHDLVNDTPSYTHTHGGSTHSHNINTQGTPLKKQLLTGFLAGIAPCFMGWSIFLVVLTTKNLFLIIPLILSFALGIAFTLCMFMFIALKLKKPLYSKFSKIGDYSPIISALILLIYSITALINL